MRRLSSLKWFGSSLAFLVTASCATPTIIDLETCLPGDPPLACDCPNGQLGEAECQSDRELGACICPEPSDSGTSSNSGTDAGSDAG